MIPFITLLQLHVSLWHIAFAVIPTSGTSPWQHHISYSQEWALCPLSVSVFISLPLHRPWVLPFLVSTFSMSLKGQFTQIIHDSSFGFVLGWWQIFGDRSPQVPSKTKTVCMTNISLVIWYCPLEENKTRAAARFIIRLVDQKKISWQHAWD